MSLPLDNVLVLDLTRALAGPFCAMMLGDLGARVIKVEQPSKGDDSRKWGPPFLGGESAYFLSVNRNKESLTLDLKAPEGKDILLSLIDRADILLENYRVGTLERLGLGWEALSGRNPRLIQVSISGFGSTGPLAFKPGYDLIAQGLGGMMSITGPEGGPPVKVGVAQADITAGMFAAFGALGALLSRGSTGRGQRVETSLLESQVAQLTFQAGRYLATGEVPGPEGNRHPLIAPYESLAVKGGFVNVAAANQELWRRFCEALDLAELVGDPRFLDNPLRLANRSVLVSLLEGRLSTLSQEEVLGRLEAAGVPCGPVATLDQVFGHPQVEALGQVVEVDHPTAGKIRLVGPPVHLGACPSRAVLPPPLLGEHTQAILCGDLGLTPQAVEHLRSSGVV